MIRQSSSQPWWSLLPLGLYQFRMQGDLCAQFDSQTLMRVDGIVKGLIEDGLSKVHGRIAAA